MKVFFSVISSLCSSFFILFLDLIFYFSLKKNYAIFPSHSLLNGNFSTLRADRGHQLLPYSACWSSLPQSSRWDKDPNSIKALEDGLNFCSFYSWSQALSSEKYFVTKTLPILPHFLMKRAKMNFLRNYCLLFVSLNDNPGSQLILKGLIKKMNQRLWFLGPFPAAFPS